MESEQRARNSGFSLLELLLVLIVGAVLIAIVAGSYFSTMKAVAVTTGADMISNLFAEAQETAAAQNMSVEVRIYELAPRPDAPPIYDAVQLHGVKPDGTTPPLGKLLFLPQGAAIDTTAPHSTLIASNAQTATPDLSDPRLDANTRAFHFLPGGGTDLDPTANWFLTVRDAAQSDPAKFPANWACVRLDPVTGRSQIYRP